MVHVQVLDNYILKAQTCSIVRCNNPELASALKPTRKCYKKILLLLAKLFLNLNKCLKPQNMFLANS